MAHRAKALALLLLLRHATGTHGKLLKAPTPPMGWNTYNAYSCSPSEQIVKLNAQGLIDLGLYDLGYDIVTVDCGWPRAESQGGRDGETGKLVWNETLFPTGPAELGEWLHGKGLKFGVYSGAGYLQCGSQDIPASLGEFLPFRLFFISVPLCRFCRADGMPGLFNSAPGKEA